MFCTLNVGVAFGEISLLAMGEGNKRTANIYSEQNESIVISYICMLTYMLMFLNFMPHTVCNTQYVSYLLVFDQRFIFIKPGFTTMFTLNKTDLFNALGLVSFQVEFYPVVRKCGK